MKFLSNTTQSPQFKTLLLTMKKNILVTGGAGFIGANLVETLLQDVRVGKVRVLDNLATGNLTNLKGFMNNPNFEFFEGDIRDYDICLKACEGMNLVSHLKIDLPRQLIINVARIAIAITGFNNFFMSLRFKKVR